MPIQGGTYGGNAVSCAAAVATLDAIEEEKVLLNVKARGAQLMNGLLAIQKGLPPGLIVDVRGRGLMVGVEFGKPWVANQAMGEGSDPQLQKKSVTERERERRRMHGPASKGFAAAVTQACGRRDMLLLSAGARETVRFLPPLTVTEQEVDLALKIFKEAVNEAASRV